MQPRTINDLSDVPEDERDGYIPAEDGTFRLHPELVELCDRHEEERAELEARTRKLRATLEDTAVKREVREALEGAGIKPQFVPVITAYLRERMTFNVDDMGEGDFRVTVADAYGEVGVEFAVNTWLATEDADAYRPAPKPTDGPLMERLRQLRATIQ